MNKLLTGAPDLRAGCVSSSTAVGGVGVMNLHSDQTLEVASHWRNLQLYARRALAEAVPDGAEVMLVDAPVYKNVGDLLIYLGTLAWLQEIGARIVAIQSSNKVTRFPINKECIILIQGGGNFGDIYPEHQLMREKILQWYPNNRIVSLPQTIKFDKEANLLLASKNINEHKNHFIFCRCQNSMYIASKYFRSAINRMAPDMATFLFPLRSYFQLLPDQPPGGTLYLLRDDEEKHSAQKSVRLGQLDRVGDWNELLGIRRRLYSRALIELDRRMPSAQTARYLVQIWRHTAQEMARYCAKQFIRHERVETSRLHGHIMASLLSLPNTVLDNNYGKNSSYVNAWHRKFCDNGLVYVESRIL